MYVRRNVSSPMLVVCFFRWFDEISVVVFVAGASLTVKVEKGRKWLQNVYIFVGLTAGSQNVRERYRVCAVSGSQNGKSELSL